MTVQTERGLDTFQKCPHVPRSDVRPRRHLIARRAVRRTMERAEEPGPRRNRAFDFRQLARQGLRRFPSAKIERGQLPARNAAHSVETRLQGFPAVLPSLPVFHDEWRDRHGCKARDVGSVQEREHAEVRVAKPVEAGGLEQLPARLPIVVPEDVADVGGARLGQVVAEERQQERSVEFGLLRRVGVRGQIASQDDGAHPIVARHVERLAIEARVAVKIRGVEDVCFGTRAQSLVRTSMRSQRPPRRAPISVTSTSRWPRRPPQSAFQAAIAVAPRFVGLNRTMRNSFVFTRRI